MTRKHEHENMNTKNEHENPKVQTERIPQNGPEQQRKTLPQH